MLTGLLQRYWPRSISVLTLAALYGLSMAPLATDAAADDCMEQGGSAICTTPELAPWKYSLCDEAGPYSFRIVIACEVWSEGNWVSYPSGPRCENGNPNALREDNLVEKAKEFERRVYGACTVNATSSGWAKAGQTISSYQCWSGGPRYENGIEVSNLLSIKNSGTLGSNCDSNWGEDVIGRRDRGLELQCPLGYTQRTVNGGTQCYRIAEQSCPVGNPVSPGSGPNCSRKTITPARAQIL